MFCAFLFFVYPVFLFCSVLVLSCLPLSICVYFSCFCCYAHLLFVSCAFVSMCLCCFHLVSVLVRPSLSFPDIPIPCFLVSVLFFAWSFHVCPFLDRFLVSFRVGSVRVVRLASCSLCSFRFVSDMFVYVRVVSLLCLCSVRVRDVSFRVFYVFRAFCFRCFAYLFYCCSSSFIFVKFISRACIFCCYSMWLFFPFAWFVFNVRFVSLRVCYSFACFVLWIYCLFFLYVICPLLFSIAFYVTCLLCSCRCFSLFFYFLSLCSVRFCSVPFVSLFRVV